MPKVAGGVEIQEPHLIRKVSKIRIKKPFRQLQNVNGDTCLKRVFSLQRRFPI